MNKMIKCPICGEQNGQDCCEFVFVRHILNNGAVEISNPSDYHFIYLCSNLHVFDSDGHQVEAV